MAETTGVFLLDGEDAGSTPWEFGSLTQEGSNTFALNAAALNHGSYGYRVAFDGTNEGCYATKTYTNQTDLYFRFYVRINTGYNTSSDGINALCSWYLTGDFVCAIRVYADGSTTPNTWVLATDWGGNLTSTTGFAIGSWIRVEVRIVNHASTGGCQVWINGTLVFDALSYNTSAYVHNRIHVGNFTGLQVPGSGDSIDFDDLKCDTSAIGPYSDSSGDPITWTTHTHRTLVFG